MISRDIRQLKLRVETHIHIIAKFMIHAGLQN